MRNHSINRLKVLALFPVLMLPSSYSLAALEEFSPYAFVGVLHDTNIFRSNDDEEDDTIGHFGAGLRSDLKLSRQHLLFQGVVDRAQYDNFDELDHTRVDGRATWAWQVGNLWSGDLGYDYNRRLSSFNEQLVREKDMRTTQTGFFEAGYQLHPDWRLAGEFDYSDVSYQDRKRLDRDATAAQFDVQYRNTLNTRVGVRVRYAKNDLQDTDVGGVSIDNDYDEVTVSGLFSWEASGKSALEARLGYTDLRYDDLDERDFQGFSGRLTYLWLLTGKTRMEIATWHETSSLDDEIASYVLTRGASIKPTWSVTPKITIEGEVSYEDDEFKGENEIRTELGLDRRDDDTWVYGISANWDPRRSLKVSLGYRREKRDSSVDVRDFDDDQVDARVQYSF
jgi:exopolysaccharide biosynthesis operon protein EpsL